MVRHTRRQVISAGLGAAVIGSTAGCTSIGTASDESDGPTAQASFFVFGDFAAAVAGEAASAETLVPIGQHGHGWEPGPEIQGTVLESELFVYGTEGFQPWADDIVTNLRDDDAAVEIVAAGAGVDLIEGGHDHDHGHGDDDHDDDHHDEHDDDHHDEHDDDHHDEHDDDQHDDEHEEDEDDHEGGMDPHFWLDPQRAKQAVDTIQEGFASVDSNNAEAYADNAESYRARLDDLDSALESTISAAPKTTVFVAGHDAFQYLEARYGLQIETLTGLSPDDQPTPRDIERAQEIIAEHDLDYVCADPLESQTAAEQLVAETDATEILPLTPIPGLTQAWVDDDWGYIEVMENVNLDSLETALDAA